MRYLVRSALAAALALMALTPMASAAPSRFTLALDCTNGANGTATIQAAHLNKQGTALILDGKAITLACGAGTTDTVAVRPSGKSDRFSFSVFQNPDTGTACGGVRLFADITTTPFPSCSSPFPVLYFSRS